MEFIVLGGGCFWCLEAAFENIKGVFNIVSGYAGGYMENPDYKQVCSGKTGHAEVIKLNFDPKIISLEQILDIFFTIHDPTTLNKQGGDIGTQYRSIILYNSEKQKESAEGLIEKLESQKIYDNEIVTKLEKLEKFYPAEEEHQNYYQKHPEKAYCAAVINPKLQKLRDKYHALLNTNQDNQ